MSNIISKGGKLAYLYPFIILCYTFSVMWGWFPMTHTIYVLFIGIAGAVVISNKYFVQKPFIFLLLYELVLALNMMMNSPLFPLRTAFYYEMLSVALTSLMAFYFMVSKDDKLLNVTITLVFIILIINAIGSLYVDTLFPGSIRAMVTEIRESGTHTLAMQFYKFGLANYALPHALPTIIPVLVYGIKTVENKRLRVILIVVLSACLLLCYLGGSTTAMSFAIFALVIAFFTKVQRGTSQFVLFGFLVVVGALLFNNDDFMLAILDSLDNMMGNEGYFHAKIMDFEYSIISESMEGTAISSRNELYSKSISAIISSPLFGVHSDIIGHHSTILDTWACLGLIGFLPYIIFIFRQIKFSSNYISKNGGIFYIEGAMMAFFMLVIKSMAGWELWLFLFTILPALTLYIENHQSKAETVIK